VKVEISSNWPLWNQLSSLSKGLSVWPPYVTIYLSRNSKHLNFDLCFDHHPHTLVLVWLGRNLLVLCLMSKVPSILCLISKVPSILAHILTFLYPFEFVLLIVRQRKECVISLWSSRLSWSHENFAELYRLQEWFHLWFVCWSSFIWLYFWRDKFGGLRLSSRQILKNILLIPPN